MHFGDRAKYTNTAEAALINCLTYIGYGMQGAS
jgi:hypothetical protein